MFLFFLAFLITCLSLSISSQHCKNVAQSFIYVYIQEHQKDDRHNKSLRTMKYWFWWPKNSSIIMYDFYLSWEVLVSIFNNNSNNVWFFFFFSRRVQNFSFFSFHASLEWAFNSHSKIVENYLTSFIISFPESPE